MKTGSRVVDDACDMSVMGVLLYMVALTFLLGDLMVVTFGADHLDPGVRYRMGVFLLIFSSFLALVGWCVRRFAAHKLASVK